MRYNLLPFADTNSVICKIIVGNKASLVQREVARRSRDGGIVMDRHKTIPQSEIRDFCQPPCVKGALSAAEKEKDI